MKLIQQFILAIQFLTRIPLTKKDVPCKTQDFQGAMTFFTFIGLIIGLLQWGTYEIFNFLVSPLIGALASTVMGIWVTGGLHLDGLSDVWDAFGANQEKEKTFEIMKDSRVGAFGVIAIVLDVFIHVIGIYSFSEYSALYILVPICAKWSVIWLCYYGTNAKNGLGALWIGNIKKQGFIINLLVLILAGIILSSFAVTISIVVISCMCAIYTKKAFDKKLGGLTGDGLGACSQMTEWALILFLLTMMKWIL
ncbi:MAG: adenosylcobinamide-GDP ribazoletransferase [Cellulosilyticaceae bacterium]